MNNSGTAVKSVLNYYKIINNNNKFIVIVDDFNLPLGTIRVRSGGSHGGHNGLKSIIANIGPEFSRLRIGIGPLPKEISVVNFVLGDFNDNEEQVLDSVISKAQEALKLFTVQSIDTVMNKFN
jgi:peptidyl-tRNA hydrolase, PTH1 family